jgi:hypothetical protein
MRQLRQRPPAATPREYLPVHGGDSPKVAPVRADSPTTRSPSEPLVRESPLGWS